MAKSRYTPAPLTLGRETWVHSATREDLIALHVRQFASQDILFASQGNPAPYRRGGMFRVAHTKTWGYPTAPVDSRRLYYRYKGSFVDSSFVGSGAPTLAFPSEAEIAFFGAKGYNRYKPDRPVSELATTLGEMHDLKQLGKMWSEGSAMHRLATRDLDNKFGRGAAIKDILKLKSLQEDLDKRIRALRRNNGKPVRRGGTIHNVENSTSSEVTLSNPGVVPVLTWGHHSGVRRTTIQTTGTRWWFSGRFRYYVPELAVPGNRWPPGLVAELVGGNLETAWNLMPWSWLLDWFTNMGDVISNIISVGARGLVSDYAYIMCERFQRTESRTDAYFNGVHLPTSSFLERSYKMRDVGSPFGFGVSPSQFTPAQGATLAAVGITHMPDGKIIPGR